MKLRKTISWIKTKIQAELFPYLEEIFTDPITKRQKQLITTLERGKANRKAGKSILS